MAATKKFGKDFPSTFHGANERFPLDESFPVVDRLFQVIQELIK
jgi:hypothetical protein